jgi:hypothetical protein
MFSSLKHDCSDYILDLLQYIQTDLLRVDKAKRARIEDIVMKFENLNNECQRDASYCISRTSGRPVRRTDSELSEIVEVPSSPGKEIGPDMPPVPTATWSVRRSASFANKYEIPRSKKRPNSISGVMEGDHPRSRFPLVMNSSITPSNLSHKLELSPRQSGASVESSSTMTQIDQRSREATNWVEDKPMLSDLNPYSSQANQQIQSRPDTADNHTKPLPQPREHPPTTVDAEHISTTFKAPTKPPIDESIPVLQAQHPRLEDTTTNRPRPYIDSHEGHTEPKTNPEELLGKIRQLRRRTHGRAKKLLDWCCRDNRS